MIWPPGVERVDEGTHYIANKDLMVYKMYDHQIEKNKQKKQQIVSFCQNMKAKLVLHSTGRIAGCFEDQLRAEDINVWKLWLQTARPMTNVVASAKL